MPKDAVGTQLVAGWRVIRIPKLFPGPRATPVPSTWIWWWPRTTALGKFHSQRYGRYRPSPLRPFFFNVLLIKEVGAQSGRADHNAWAGIAGLTIDSTEHLGERKELLCICRMGLQVPSYFSMQTAGRGLALSIPSSYLFRPRRALTWGACSSSRISLTDAAMVGSWIANVML